MLLPEIRLFLTLLLKDCVAFYKARVKGVSSAYINFILNSSRTSTTYYSESAVNVTSEIDVTGDITLLTGSLKQANVTCTVLNEEQVALAQNFTVYYEKDGSLSPEE
jgi:hypothetical protein